MWWLASLIFSSCFVVHSTGPIHKLRLYTHGATVHVSPARKAAQKITEPFYNTHAWQVMRARCIRGDNRACVACGATDERLYAAHIVDRNDGGLDQLDNLVTLCATCNGRDTAEKAKRKRERELKGRGGLKV